MFNRQVFPSASINYALTKEDAGVASTTIANALKFDTRKTIQTTTFNTDDDAKTVLEFKLGIKKANELMRESVPVYYWRTRFCKPLNKEQLFVSWTTNGQLMNVFHKIENDIKLPSLSKEDALQKAMVIAARLGKQDLSKYKLFDYGAEPKANRTDQHFEFVREMGYPESNLHVRIEFAGDTLTEYRYFLQPSDTWTREYKKIREDNELLGKIASFFIFVFIVAAVASFVHGLNTKNIRWRFAFTCAVIVSVLYLLDQANSWTNTIDSTYDTSLTFANFVTKTVLTNLLAVVGILILTLIMVGGAENVYRRCFPKHMAMSNLLSIRGMAQPEYFQRSVYGYLIVGGMMLWVICYYLVGEKFNFFCPLGVDDYRAVGTVCPAVSAALIGVSAAGLEEFSCRVVALGLLTKFLRNFWVANIIQAVVWGFAHSQYPQQPSYARGIELSVVGMWFGCITNTLGVFPCFVAHYLYDAFLTAEPVFATHQPGLTLPAMLVLVPFLVVPWWARRWVKKRGIDSNADLSNAAEQLPPPLQKHVEEVVDRSATKYSPLSKSLRVGLLTLTIIGCCSAFLPLSEPVGAAKKMLIGHHEALVLAKKYLAEDGVKSTDWLTTTEMVTKPDDSETLKWQYLYEQLGKEKLAKIYNTSQPCIEWRIRFFKPLESKLYWVFLDCVGGKRASAVEDGDEGKGAKLTEAEALAIIDNYLKKYRRDCLPYQLVGRNKIEHPDRTDYKFEMIIPHFYAGITPGKLKAEVKGSEISELLVDWEVPDSWMWPRKTLKWYQQLDTVFRYAVGIILVIVALGWGVHVLWATSIRWKGPLLVFSVGFTAIVAYVANTFVKLLTNYNTAESLNSFMAQAVAAESLKILLLGVGLLLCCLAGFATVRLSFPEIANQLRHSLLIKPHNSYERALRSNVWLDGAVGSYAFLGSVMLLKYVQQILEDRFSPELRLDIPHSLPAMFSTSIPALDLVTALVLGSIVGLMVLSVVAGVWKRFVRSDIKAFALICLFAGIYSGTRWFEQDVAIDFLYSSLMGFTAYIFVRRIFRSNLPAYVFAILTLTAISRLGEIMTHGQKIAIPEIAIISFVLALPLVATLYVYFVDKQKGTTVAPGEGAVTSPIQLAPELSVEESATTSPIQSSSESSIEESLITPPIQPSPELSVEESAATPQPDPESSVEESAATPQSDSESSAE